MAPPIGIAEWITPKSAGHAPSARSGHSMTIVGRRAIIFGGMGETAGLATIYNDVYALDLDGNEPTWSTLECSGSPESRWRHVAATLGEESMIVFGGIGKSKRFNDVWVLDMFQDSNPTWSEKNVSGTPPCPRGHHSASFVDDKFYIFGGYGGHGQRRAFYNDLHVLKAVGDGDQMEWTKEETNGPVPKPRGDHSSSVISLSMSPESKFLFIMGGRDHSSFFNDIHFLNITTMTWCNLPNTPNPVAPLFMCNHMALGIQSVPNYKIFVFGGQAGNSVVRSDWKYINAVNCMDAGRMEWMASDNSGSSFVQGNFPTAREDCAYVYDRKNNRIVIHGGWADKWFSELYYLDVASIVGPPYACYSLIPNEGPMTGQTPIKLIGEDFTPATSIKIQFSDGKNIEVVDGKYVNSTMLTCNSPDWTKYAAGEVNIRVNLRGEGWTVNIVKWNFFVNTRPSKCIAYGPGLFESDNAGWGFPAIFKVQAKDITGRNRNTGGEASYWKPNIIFKPTGESIPCRVDDCKDGTYDFTYVPIHPGSYVIEVGYCDPLVSSEITYIRGSPWTASFDDPWTKAKTPGDAPKATPGLQTCTLVKKMVMYGGGSEVVCFDPETLVWERPEIEGTPPADRTAHTITPIDNEKAVVCGGVFGEGQYRNDVSLLVCEKGKWRWQEVGDVLGDKFAPRAHHAACLIPVGKRLVVFGGVNADGEKIDDLMVLSAANAAKMEWMGIKKKVTEEQPEDDAQVAAPDGAAAPQGAAAAEGPPASETAAASGPAGNDDNEDGEEEHTEKERGKEAQEPVRVIPELKEIPGKRRNHGVASVEGVVYAFGGNVEVEGQAVMTALTVVGEFEMEGKTLAKGDAIRWRKLKVSGDIPCPRADFMLATMDGKVVLQGGRDMDGVLLDDIYSLDPATGVWSILYKSNNAWQKNGHVLSCLIAKRLVVASTKSADIKNKFEDVRILEFGKIADQHALIPDMGKRILKELKALELFNKDSLTNLSLDPTKEPNEEKQREILLKVKGCIYQVKVDQPQIELQLDILKDALAYMHKQGVSTEKMEKEMKDIVENFSSVKKQAPMASEVIKPVQQREADKIRAEVERFTMKVKVIAREFTEKPFNNYETGIDASYSSIVETKNSLRHLDTELSGLVHFATVFEFLEITEEAKNTVGQLHSDLNTLLQLWHFIAMVGFFMSVWNKTLWADINTETMEDGTKTLFKQLRSLDKVAKMTNAYSVLESQIKGFLTTLPLVADLSHPSMRVRHWDLLRELTKKQFDETSSSFSLQELTNLHLDDFEDDVGEIVNRAQKEEKMEQALDKIEGVWKNLEFQFIQHKQTEIMMIKLSEEDFETLEDHQVQIQNMMGSRYLPTFEKQVTSWQKKLSAVADVVGIMAEIQRTWAYLETLFIGSEEVKKELPEDATRFAGIDENVKEILSDIFKVKNSVLACEKDGILKKLEKLKSDLEICEKSLANYLEQKRRIFPRFYFVSTSDLLDILSSGNDPVKSKIIAAIETLKLESGETSADRPSALGFESCVGVEHIDLSKPLKIEGRVENYLQDVIQNVISSLRDILVKSIDSFATTPTEKWVKREPNQIILTTSLIYFTKKMEESFVAIKNGDDKAMDKMLQSKKDALTELIDLVRTNLTKAERMKIMCLITLDAHSRDISQNLVEGKVTEVTQFEWQSQLRFEWRASEGDCFIMIVDAEFHYCFEYIGNGARLVITPLTDRIYVTATQALKLSMGCAPAGPAGTGKTETTKDLAAMMAVCIYVFNCAPEMDYKSMGDIWKGLGASGAWGCFDEFNRLIAEVLSVCSTQYKCVLDSIKGNRDTFILEGAELKLNPSCGAYITMNPGYIGRTALPESLKVLFRPVTVVVPDFALICENMLMAEGFTQAKLLGTKFINLYTLCADLLSKAMHYDWGLRAIKSVLRVAGDFKRAEPEVSELALLFRALRDFNLPKIVGDDLIIFLGLLGDLFPGIEIPRQRNWDNEKIIAEATVEAGLQPDDNFQLKVVQLDELLSIRHSVFIMGSSGTGKSECWKILSAAKIKQGNKCQCRDLDPKAITTYDFYGYVSLATREWKDGIFSNLMRELANAPDTNSKWIILDGDLDANWIESMNSVMDDNKLLTLASNERILLKPHMKLIFEIRDLKLSTAYAGISYITDQRSQWYSYVQSWIQKRTEDNAERKHMILSMFDKYVDETLLALKKEFKHMVPMLDFNLVQSLCHVLSGLLTADNVPHNDPNEAIRIETYFVFAAIWAFGSAYSITDGTDFKKNFSTFWKGKWAAIKLPAKGSVFDYFIEKSSQKFVPWSQIVAQIEYASTTPMDAVTVPTGETTSISFYLDLLVELRRPALLVGLAGAGKTALINGKLRNLPEDYMSLTINFNYYTDGAGFQAVLEGALEKKAGRNYGPPGNKKLIYFVDDLNMPQLDPYETATTISLLRQYMDYQHWYDLSKLQLRVINNCQVLSSMNPTCGSFVINPRLQRHYMTFAIGFPGQEALMTIFSTFLNGHVKDFDAKIADVAFQNKIIQAALELHNKVSGQFRKTANNFHYEFSIRHLANVFKGILMSDPAFFPEPAKFASLFLHECERVYGDRLVSPKDLEAYLKISKDTGKKYFKELDSAIVFPNPHIFCNCWKDLDEKSYNSVSAMDKLGKILGDALNSYNETNAAMNLVLFDDAMKHVCRIARILQSGHALLVGVGGSGKQSLTRLSAFICNCSVVQIVLSGTYSMNDLKEDIKQMYMKSGVKNEPLVFLFTDSQIADEKFLVYMNEMLSSGKIPNLFAADEIDTIYNSLRSEGKSEGISDTKEAMYDYFISKVKKNLHVCLCFSPVGENFRRRASRFPSLINCTVIDWFQPWPEQALYDVAKRFLGEVSDLGDPECREGIIKFMPFSFAAVNNASAEYLRQERRYNYTTPKSFLELIYLYRNMLAKERQSLTSDVDRLSTGLDKLEKTSKDVALLEEEIKVKSVEVEAKKLQADQIAEKVGGEKAKVEVAAAGANDEAAKCAVIAENAGNMQIECERELEAAIPAVQKAEAALDSLKKKELDELKSLAKPPQGVDDVTAAILAIKGEPAKNRDWAAAKNMMKDVNKFMEELKGLKVVIDNGQLTAKSVDGARPYLALEHVKDVDIMKKKSSAAGGLCEFLSAIVQYYDIVVKVEPLRNALRTAQDELASANTKLAEVRAYVADLEAKLAVLVADFDKVVTEKNRVVAEGDRLQNKLALAQRLMAALGSEQERWKINVASMRSDAVLLAGDVLLAASFVSYIGCFNKRFRDMLLNQTMIPFLQKNHIPMSASADPLTLLASPAVVAEWNGQGLPADRVSVENGAISTFAERWPVMIDPQLQGIVWVKEKENVNNLQITRLGNKQLLNTMERALENGWSVMIENLQESLDAVLAPIIGRQKIKKGRNYFVKVGDKEVEYNPKFKLYLHTKLANPHYPPEIQAECTLINFMVTEDGLEDQLLAKVVTKERPDLEEEKSFLIKQQNEFKIKLKELEAGLLRQLAEAQGDITENIELIESLEDAKRLSIEINEKVTIAQDTEIKINEAREEYRGVANRGALLFFALGEMFKVHSFYHYSLSAFTAVFLRAIDWAGKRYLGAPIHVPKQLQLCATNPFQKFRTVQLLLRAAAKGFIGGDEEKGPGKPSTKVELNLKARLLDLVSSITYQVFNFCRRGLFDKHKLLFTTSVVIKVLQRMKRLEPEEVSFIMLGKRSVLPPTMHVDMQSWCSEVAWAGAHALQDVKRFEKLCSDMEGEMNKWQAWMVDERPEDRALPGEYDKVTPFQKLLILRQLRPDRLTGAIRAWINGAMGRRYIDEEAFDIFSIYRESTPETAMYFYLFPGADIVADLAPLMRAKGFTIENGKFVNISMGQGQEKVAEEALDRCMKEGGWVFLQNIHLMSQWVKQLERKLEQSFDPDTNRDFRCFLSAEPPGLPLQQTIPEAILQNSIKISNEPAQSLRQLLFRAWNNFNQGTMDACKRQKDFRTILLALCVFHAEVNGRKKFGNMGWNCGHIYGFTMGDLTQCADVLNNQLNARSGPRAGEEAPLRDLRYIFGEIMYGGHITDKWDRRTNVTYLDVIITPRLFEPDFELFPGFKTKMDGTWEDYMSYVENDLPPESPMAFGMHPNAEINFLMSEQRDLFSDLLSIGGGGGTGGGGKTREQVVDGIIENLSGKLPLDFDNLDLKQRIGSDLSPYLVVLIQERERFNGLLQEMRQTLKELRLGLDGALNISDKMETMMNAMVIEKIPSTWEKMAWRTNKSLSIWFADVGSRVKQLEDWGATLVMPPSLWLAGCFNPMAFITAVMQTTARKRGWPLDDVVTFTDPTRMDWDEPDAQPDEGTYVHGMYIEGARWDREAGEIRDSHLRDLTPQMPVIHLVAIPRTEVKLTGYHDTPVYYVSQRGGGNPPGSYVFFATLKTSEPTTKTLYGVYSYKWVLAAVGLLLQVE